MSRLQVFASVALFAMAPMWVVAENRELAGGNWQQPRAALHRYESVEPHMGTLVKITLYARGADEARAGFDAAFSRIRALDRTLSDYKADSELNQLSKSPSGVPIAVSDDLWRVVSASQELAAATGGAFDITQGPVIKLWRQARASGRLPDEQALREAANRSGYQKLHVEEIPVPRSCRSQLDERTPASEPRERAARGGAGPGAPASACVGESEGRSPSGKKTVTLDASGMALDVGAIGKGYAASEALAVLERRGLRSALVAVSGDLAFGDAPPGKAGWRIAIHEQSEADAHGIPAVVELTNAAVSTAGASEQHLDAGGKRYSHIIDPARRAGLTEDITVTVIAKHGLDADGLDTAISVLGVERGLALINAWRDAAALIVRRSRTGAELIPSSRFWSVIGEPGSSDHGELHRDAVLPPFPRVFHQRTPPTGTSCVSPSAIVVTVAVCDEKMNHRAVDGR